MSDISQYLNTYYSFNQPDVNLNGKIQNWTQKFVIPTNYSTISNLNTSFDFAITSDSLIIISCAALEIYYKKRNSTSEVWNNSNYRLTTPTGSLYNSIAITPDGSTVVVASDYVYFFKNPLYDTTTNNSRIRIDNVIRNYNCVAITKDGNRIVASSSSAYSVIYCANWNGSNYTSFTTIQTNTGSYLGVAISSNGDRIVYGNSDGNWYLSFWNGTNYPNGSLISHIGTVTVGKPCFSNDARILFLSYRSSISIRYFIYNYITYSYEFVSDIGLGAYICSGLSIIESYNNCRVYSLEYNTGRLVYKDLTYTLLPLYDATLNGDAYISTTNYKTGNGSLEIAKNTITTQGTSTTFSGQASNTLHISITDDQLTILCSNYDGLIYYQTRDNTSTNFNGVWIQTADSTQTSRNYYDIPVTANGSKFATCVKNGYVYFATKNGTGGYDNITQTLDNTSRNYQGLAMTKDGNRIVACAGSDGIYFANWDGTNSNYNVFTRTLETRIVDFYSIAISSNSDRIVYGELSNNWYLSYWNGSNYNNGSNFYNLTLTSKKPRGCCFNNDASILFLSYSSTTSQEYGIYNNNTRTYDRFTNISNNLIPNSIDCRNIWCIDSSSNMTIYGYNYSSATIYYGNISYTTINEVMRTIIKNSSFSSTIVPTYAYYPNGTDIIDWTISGGAFGLSSRNSTIFNNVLSSLPTNIRQYLFAQMLLSRGSTGISSISQSIYLNKGYYELSFYYSARGGYNSIYTLTVSVGTTNIITKLIANSALWQFTTSQFNIETDNSYNLKFSFNLPVAVTNFTDITYCITGINLTKILKHATITHSISNNGLTIAGWFRSNYNLNNAVIFDFCGIGGIFDTSGIIIGHENNNIRLLLQNNNNLSFDISGSPSIITSSNNINNNLWNHIAITMDYTTNSTSTITAYINGLTSNTFTGKSYPANIKRPLCYLGRSNMYNIPAFFGNIDDFRIYNNVLSATDILGLYTNTNVQNNYMNSKIYTLQSASVDNPNTISELFADFDASLNVTSTSNKVSNWVDAYKSVSASQLTNTLMPLLTTNFINLYPAIDFASVPGSLLKTTDTNSTTQNLTLFFVMKITSNTSDIYKNFCSSLGGWKLGSLNLSVKYSEIILAVNAGGTENNFNTGIALQLNVPFILTFNVTSVGGTVGTARYNGSYITSNNVYNTTATNLISNFEFGGFSGETTRTFNGGIGEIIQYNRTLLLSEIILIENYLSSKWGITLSSDKKYEYYWNDPYAITNTIINKANPCNFYYTYNNKSLLTSAKVSVIINDSVTLKLNGIIQTNMLNSGNTIYSDPVTVPLINGNNLFEFITYNNGGSAYFAAYVTDSNNNYLFSTNNTINGWNINIIGLYLGVYPVSSLLVNDSTSREYINSTAITTPTNYNTFNIDLSSNKSCKRIKTIDFNFETSNHNDLANIFLSYP